MKNFLKSIKIFDGKTLPRKIFFFYFLTILIGSSLLLLPISIKEGQSTLSIIDAIFTASSAFSDTGLIVKHTGEYFTIFGQVVILLLIQLGGIGIMAVKVLFFILIGKKIGFEERLFVSSERGTGKVGGTIHLMKNALIIILSSEFIAMILFSIRYFNNYFEYFNNDIFQVIFTAAFSSISSINNAGFDILVNSNSLSIFANDYYIQILTIVCLVFGGLGFPVIYDIKNWNINIKNKN